MTSQQIGGSSSGKVTPTNEETLVSRLTPLLRIDYSSLGASQVLQAITNVVHVFPNAPTKDLIQETLDEYSTFPIPSPLLGCISEYLFCVWNDIQGRKAARDSIVDYFSFITAENSNVMKISSAPEIKSDETFKRLDDYLYKCHQRAAQLCHGRLIIFDGTTNVEKYLLFKHQVNQLIASTGDFHSHVNVEVLLHCLRNSALDFARQQIIAQNLYDKPGSEALSLLWDALDVIYKTDAARRHISTSFYSMKQGISESTAGYVSRFRSAVDLQRTISDITDVDCIVRLSIGLTNSTSLLARGITDSMNLVDFNQYCVQLLNTTNALSSFHQPAPVQERRVNQNSAINDHGHASKRCSRCGDPTHEVGSCTRAVRYPCRLCNKLDHFTRVCPSKRHSKFDRRKGNSGLTHNLIDAAISDSELSNNTTSIRLDLSSHSIDSRLIDQARDHEVPITFVGRHNSQSITGLLDTGAAGNFIRSDQAMILCNQGIIRRKQVHELHQPVFVTYGNNQKEAISTYVALKIEGSSNDILAFVTENCNFPFILGRPGLKAMGLNLNINDSFAVHVNSMKNAMASNSMTVGIPISDSQTDHEEPRSINATSNHSVQSAIHMMIEPSVQDIQEATIELVLQETDCDENNLLSIIHDARGKHLMVSHQLLENAHVSPFRCPRRMKSMIDHQIIHAKLELMANQGKVRIVSSHECIVVLEIVLVDKCPSTGPRVFPDKNENIERRYRITLDLRPLNQMTLSITDNLTSFIPKDSNFSDEKAEPQHQFSAMETLKWLQTDINAPVAYGKIDISDAYQSIYVPPRLARLFCYASQTSKGIEYYQFNTLPQGWKFSPLLFSISIEYVLSLCSGELQSINVTVRHFQDDILLKSTNSFLIKSGIKIIQEKLLDLGFSVNEAKTVVSDSITFCGLNLSGKGMTPSPKCPITEQLAVHQWSLITSAKKTSKQITLLQEMIGRINYLRGYLPGSVLLKLSTLYQSVSNLLKGNEVNFAELQPLYMEICQAVLGGTFVLAFGILRDSLFSVVVTDANSDGYGGIIYKLISSNRKSIQCNSSVESIIDTLKNELKLNSELNYCLIPLKVTAGSFGAVEQRQSSTYRERLAMLYVVDEFYQYIDCPGVIITDNKNCQLQWRNVDEYLTHCGDLNKGALFTNWIRFSATISRILWVARECTGLVDELARSISVTKTAPSKESKPSPPVQRNTPIPIESANPITSANAVHVDSDGGRAVDIQLTPPPEPSRKFRLSVLFDHFRNDIVDAYKSDVTRYLDVKLLDIYQHLAHGTSTDTRVFNLSRRFALHENVMYHVNFNGVPKVYLPSGGKIDSHIDNDVMTGSIRAYILHSYHDKTVHAGYQKLMYEISQNFWWPSIISDCLTYVKSCLICLENKSRFTRYIGDLRSTNGSKPFSILIVDYCQVFNQSVLIIADSFSSYCCLVPTDDITAATTAQALFDFSLKFGFPDMIASDRGSSFVNGVIDEFSRCYRVDWKLSSSYSPRSQGLAERIVQALKQCLKLLKNRSIPLLDQIGLIQLFHNCSNVGGLPFSPYQIVFNRSPKSAFLVDSELEIDGGINDDFLLRGVEIRELFTSFREIMRSRIHDAYAAKSPATGLQTGDSVMRIFLTGSFGQKVSGPHRILTKVNDSFRISGYDYPIPSYQLRLVPPRPQQIAMQSQTEPETLPFHTDLMKAKQFDLVAFEAEADQIDIGRIDGINYEQRLLTITRYWFDHQSQCWSVWEGEIIEVNFEQVVFHPIKLRNGKIPKATLRMLLT